MRKYLLLLLTVFFLLTPKVHAFDDGQMLLAMAEAEAGMIIRTMGGATCGASGVIFWWRVEDEDLQGDCTGSGAPYACCSAENAGTCDYHALSITNGTLSGASIAAGAKYIGTYGLDFDAGYEYWYIGTPSITLDQEARIGFWVKINTWVTGAKMAGVYIDGDNFIRIGMVGTGSSDIELACYWEDDNIPRTTFSTTTANMSTGTWYFVELAYEYSGNYREFFVNGVSKGSDSNTIDVFTSAVTNVFVGNVHSYAADVFIDNVIISTDSTDDLYSICSTETEYPF